MTSATNSIRSLLQNTNLKSIVGNSTWLLLDKILRIISGLFIGTLVAKYFGPDNYGLYSYVVSLVSLISIISTLGLEQIVIKEMVINQKKQDLLLGTAFVLRLIGSLVLVVISTILVHIINSGNHIITSMALIVSTGYIFQALNVIEDWFQSKLKSKYIVISRDIALILGLLAKLYIINTQQSIVSLAYVLSVEIFITSSLLVYYFINNNQQIIRWKFNVEIARNLLRQSWPLITSTIMVSIYMKIDQIMIMNLNSSSQGGQYAAAVQLSEAWYFIPTIITSSVYPHLLKIIDDKYYFSKRNSQLLNILALTSYLICIPVVILSDQVVSILYGPDFPDTGIILAFHIWSLMFVSMGVGQSPWVISKELTKITMVWSFIGALTNIILNILVLPKYGGVGAAIASLISYALSGFLLNYFNKETRAIFWVQLRALLLVDLLSIIITHRYKKKTV